jgi:Protein of unknown function C-terminus (DUF2399)
VSAAPEPVAAITLRGVPDGLQARPLHQYRTAASGERVPIRTRRGLLKLTRVELTAAAIIPGEADLEDRDERFLLGAGRRTWQAIERRYSADAWDTCIAFARAGIVRLRCDVSDDLEIGRVVDWTLTSSWAERRAAQAADRTASREARQARAHEAADLVRDICPELADALRRLPGHAPGLPALIAVTVDLSEGVVNPNPRSFSQRHFGSTKAHDDIASVLERVGVPEWVADATGVRRSSRIGVAGRITISTATSSFTAATLSGPVIVRADQRDLRLALNEGHPPLVLVENLQAAETLADTREDLAIVYTAGMPGRATIEHVRRLAAGANTTVIATDADLGGIRIAEQLLSAAPHARLLDVGTVPHEPSTPWSSDNGYRRSIAKSLEGSAAPLAEAVLARGYPVEQELLIVEAVNTCLAR